MFDSYFVVYKFIQDLHFFVTGGDEENELILASVLQGFSEAIYYLLRCGHFLCRTLLSFLTSIINACQYCILF